MRIDTPYGKADMPDCYANEYKNKTNIELLEILINQNKRFLDPVLVQICIDKDLLRKGEAVEDLEMKLDDLKIQAYSELKAENEKLRAQIPTYDYKAYESDLEEIVKDLQRQLKEKDKEINLINGSLEAKQSTLNYYRDMYKLRYEKIAKQVCNGIETQANKHAAYDKNGKWLAFCVLQGILDRTKKGESL